MQGRVKFAVYLTSLISALLILIFNIPSRKNLDYNITTLPTKEDLNNFYKNDLITKDQYELQQSFHTYVQHSSLSLLDFIIIALIEVIKVIFLDKPIYLDVQDENQIYDEEKIPSYIKGKKRKHLLDEKEIPYIKLIITIILITKDISILPLKLISYEWNKINGFVQYGEVISHIFLSPSVLFSLQHLAYSRLAIIQDIAEDTENENKIENIIIYFMHCIRIYLCGCLFASIPFIVCGSIFGIIITVIFCLTTLGLFIPLLILSYVWKRQGFSNRTFIPLNLIIFIGVGMIASISYIIQSGMLISDGQSIKSILKFYFGPNIFSLWYFAENSIDNNSWQNQIDFFVRIIAVI